jgi:hypothetical protein
VARFIERAIVGGEAMFAKQLVRFKVELASCVG